MQLLKKLSSDVVAKIKKVKKNFDKIRSSRDYVVPPEVFLVFLKIESLVCC